MIETPEPDTPEEASAESVAPSGADVVEASSDDAQASAASSHVGDVLAQVKERGFITTGEIFAAFPDLEPDTNELRELWEMFESRGIKVLDEIAEELQLEDQRRAGGTSSEPPVAPAPRRRATEAREHRPSGASRAGASPRPASDNENADAELAAVRSASARVTH